MALYWTVSYSFQVVQQYFITGWGSLFLVPDLLTGLFGGQNTSKDKASSKEVSRETRSKSYTGDNKREQELLAQANNADDALDGDAVGPVASKLASSSNGNSQRGNTPYNRRQSASARRRGGTQKSRG